MNTRWLKAYTHLLRSLIHCRRALMLKHAGSHIQELKLERVFANMFACARASVQDRARTSVPTA